jgi:hypothetical protein
MPTQGQVRCFQCSCLSLLQTVSNTEGKFQPAPHILVLNPCLCLLVVLFTKYLSKSFVVSPKVISVRSTSIQISVLPILLSFYEFSKGERPWTGNSPLLTNNGLLYRTKLKPWGGLTGRALAMFWFLILAMAWVLCTNGFWTGTYSLCIFLFLCILQHKSLKRKERRNGTSVWNPSVCFSAWLLESWVPLQVHRCQTLWSFPTGPLLHLDHLLCPSP